MLQAGDRVSETHQVFLRLPSEHLDRVYARARGAGVTLNAKRKPLFRDTGLRLGVQEIARYRWHQGDVERLATVLRRLVDDDVSVKKEVRQQVRDLAKLNTFLPELYVTPAGPRTG